MFIFYDLRLDFIRIRNLHHNIILNRPDLSVYPFDFGCKDTCSVELSRVDTGTNPFGHLPVV